MLSANSLDFHICFSLTCSSSSPTTPLTVRSSAQPITLGLLPACPPLTRSRRTNQPRKFSDCSVASNPLLAAGGDLLLFRRPELYHVTALENRHTNAPVRFVGGLSLVIRAFEDVYGNLEGRGLEALARLFAQNVRVCVYPMTAADLQEWLTSVSIAVGSGVS
jgi:hypothetical protein